MASPSTIEDLCNLGLSHLSSTAQLTTYATEDTLEGRTARRFYEQTRDSLLSLRDWAFARKTVELADVTETDAPPARWSYSYTYPSDCLAVRRVPQGLTPYDSYRFEVVANGAEDGRLLVCDVAEACAVYTFRNTDIATYPATFVEALSWYLAFQFAVPITGDQDARDQLGKQANAFLVLAGATNANEGAMAHNAEAEWTAGR